MPRFRHVIHTRGDDLPGHLAHTLCGRIVAYGRQPNVPRGDARFCARCHALDETAVSRAPTDLVVRAPVRNGARFTRRRSPDMYSPKVPERLSPILYELGRERGQPMTHLVTEAVERYLETEGRLGEAMAEARTNKIVQLNGKERHTA